MLATMIQASALAIGFEVLGEPAASVKLSERPLDHPAPWQEQEAFGLVGPLDDLDRCGDQVCMFGSKLMGQA